MYRIMHAAAARRISTRRSSKARKPVRSGFLPSTSSRSRRFKAQNIQDTVVFFGSARIHSRERAEQALEQLERRVGRASRAAEREAHLARGRKAVEWSRYYEEARELARLLTDVVDARSNRRTTASSSPPAAGPASWKRPTAAPRRPAARPSA